MAYHDGLCDECGSRATKISPMYCLCFKCWDDQGDDDE